MQVFQKKKIYLEGIHIHTHTHKRFGIFIIRIPEEN